MAESVGDFFVKFFFNVDKQSAGAAEQTLASLKTGYDSLTKKAFAFNEITTAVGIALAPLKAAVASIVNVAKEADEMNDLADAVGTSVQELQKMQFVGKLAGTSVEGINGGMRSLSKELNAAAGGSKESAASFGKMGIKFKDVNGHMRQVGEVFPEVLQHIAGLKTDGEKAQAAMAAFGKSGLELLPMLKKSKEELAGLGAEFDQLGGGFDSDFIKISGEFGDNMDRARLIFNNMRREIATGVMPVLNRLLDRFVVWGRNNWPAIEAALKKFGDVLADIFTETAVDAFDTFLTFASEVLGTKSGWETLGTALKVIGVALAGWIIFNNPAVAVVGLFVGFIEDLMGAMQGKDSLIGRVALSLHDFFAEAFDGAKFWKSLAELFDRVIDQFTDMDKLLKNLKSGFGVFSALGNAYDTFTKDLPAQQLGIEKQKVLESMSPRAGKVALDAGLLGATTKAQVDRIANAVTNVQMTINASPNMDTKALAQKIRAEIEQKIGGGISDDLALEGQ